jgi:hypothetical protein
VTFFKGLERLLYDPAVWPTFTFWRLVFKKTILSFNLLSKKIIGPTAIRTSPIATETKHVKAPARITIRDPTAINLLSNSASLLCCIT